MSLIEQAAKRLEELRRAGVGAEESETDSATPPHLAEHVPTPEAVVRGLSSRSPLLSSTATAEVAEAVPAFKRGAPSIARPSQSRAVTIDLERLKMRGFVTPDAPRSQIADEFRVIKRPIVSNAHGVGGPKVKNGNLIMVTSALPREGKTFTAVNLALSIAMEVDTTVLLVDGDVAHPDLPNILATPKGPGLLEVLTRDDIGLGDALVRTNVENLTVLPAGSPQRRATELLASEQMGILLRELATRYSDRIIVFDSPPLLATTEARVLATHMGQIVMVVAADSTRQNQVMLALSTIESCEVVLMMLNKADKTDVGTYYGYYADDQPR